MDGYVNDGCAGAEQVRVEELQNREIDSALNGHIPRIFRVQQQASGGVERGVLGDKADAAEIDGAGRGHDMHRLSVAQNQVLQLDARHRTRVGAGVELHGGERHVGLHRRKLIERTGDDGLAFDEAIERKFFAKMFAGRKIVQRRERDAGDGKVGLAAIIAFHAPFAAPMDLDIVQGGRGGQREKRKLGGGGDSKIAIGAAIESGVANGEIAIERCQIHHAVHDFGASAGLQIQTSAEAAFEILQMLDRGQIDATGGHVEAERTVLPVAGRVIVIAGQGEASRAIARFATGKFERRVGERDIGASLRNVLVKGVEIFDGHRAGKQRRFERTGNANRGGNQPRGGWRLPACFRGQSLNVGIA